MKQIGQVTPISVRGSKSLLRRLIHFIRRIGDSLDRVTYFMAPPDMTAHETPFTASRAPIILGMWLVVGVFGVLGTWAAIAPLESAAVASGRVVVDSNRKSIQHLEGGIVEEIYVTEGKTVKMGEPLVKLNATASRAKLDTLKSQYVAARATEVRLVAERDGKDSLTIPNDITSMTGVANMAETLDSQKGFFESRRKALEGQISVLKQKAEQSKREIQGFQAQIKSADGQLRLLNEEIDVVAKLLKEGNAVKPRLLNLQRQAEELMGRRGEYNALISRAEQTIAETQLAVTSQRNEFMNNVMKELKDTQVLVADLQERIRASSDIVKRVVITSPINGIVTALHVHTIGGVIGPGEKIMEVVPTNDKLIIEARVSPQDIDVVHSDLLARVRLTAYKTRKVPMVEGKVINVSADRFDDERTGVSYYLARVEVDAKEIAAIKTVAIKLQPGMPADVLIITGKRTPLSYMLSPITDSLNRAFREQ